MNGRTGCENPIPALCFPTRISPLHWRVPLLFPCWLNADGPPLFHAMLCEAIGSLVEENGYVFCLQEELSHSSLVEELICVVTRKFGSLFLR